MRNSNSRVAALQQLADDWMALSAETVAMRRAGSTEAATDVARSDRAKAGMDRIRSLVAAMEDAERAVLAARQEEWQQAVDFSSRVTWGGSVVLLVLIAGAAVTASRQYRAREKEMWIRAGQTDLSDRLRGRTAARFARREDPRVSRRVPARARRRHLHQGPGGYFPTIRLARAVAGECR